MEGGTLDVVAGSTENYEVTSGAAEEVIDAPINDNTLAIVDGVAKTSLDPATDFGDGKKVVLLKDYTTEITLGSCEIVGTRESIALVEQDVELGFHAPEAL